MRIRRRKKPRERVVEQLQHTGEAAKETLEQVGPALQRQRERLVESLREAVPERVVERLPAPAARLVGRRKRRGGWIPFLLALVAGAGAGAGIGLLLVRRAGASAPGGLPARVNAGAARLRVQAQDGLGRARRQVQQALPQRQQTAGTTVTVVSPAEERALTAGVLPEESARGAALAGRVTTPARNAIDRVKTRWQEAVAAGKEASAEKQAELRRQYLEDTKRI